MRPQDLECEAQFELNMWKCREAKRRPATLLIENWVYFFLQREEYHDRLRKGISKEDSIAKVLAEWDATFEQLNLKDKKENAIPENMSHFYPRTEPYYLSHFWDSTETQNNLSHLNLSPVLYKVTHFLDQNKATTYWDKKKTFNKVRPYHTSSNPDNKP